ncbi:hypothetical protein GCM10023346_21590 [Arthrobacter gyeryongensis]|uniref:Uncharacterized protein n=1 Tax=Arthrobacter gyeryongensis TaxID=1650592 RepID=A0ABP9SEY6_9MICC
MGLGFGARDRQWEGAGKFFRWSAGPTLPVTHLSERVPRQATIHQAQGSLSISAAQNDGLPDDILSTRCLVLDFNNTFRQSAYLKYAENSPT